MNIVYFILVILVIGKILMTAYIIAALAWASYVVYHSKKESGYLGKFILNLFLFPYFFYIARKKPYCILVNKNLKK